MRAPGRHTRSALQPRARAERIPCGRPSWPPPPIGCVAGLAASIQAPRGSRRLRARQLRAACSRASATLRASALPAPQLGAPTPRRAAVSHKVRRGAAGTPRARPTAGLAGVCWSAPRRASSGPASAPRCARACKAHSPGTPRAHRRGPGRAGPPTPRAALARKRRRAPGRACKVLAALAPTRRVFWQPRQPESQASAARYAPQGQAAARSALRGAQMRAALRRSALRCRPRRLSGWRGSQKTRRSGGAASRLNLLARASAGRKARP
jgi:hypothetical protein